LPSIYHIHSCRDDEVNANTTINVNANANTGPSCGIVVAVRTNKNNWRTARVDHKGTLQFSSFYL